ncbi:hypothetical protein EDB87DRAFT_1581886 [Lactarius vividus]|nr:hypothetical protein EDB87DRAFT_1581886 [Lactarius vividus]
MSSLIVYQGKMTAGTYMENENLYVVFPSGIADGALAYVLGTWTKDASGTKNSPLTMNGEYYHLKVDVISGDQITVLLLNERDEPSSSWSGKAPPSLRVAALLSVLVSGWRQEGMGPAHSTGTCSSKLVDCTETGQKHEVLLDRGMSGLHFRGELATGGWDPPPGAS